MKRRLCLILFLLMLVTCVTASGEAADWNYDANYGILRGYNGAGGDVVVPGELDGFTVDVIGVSVFRGETITSLTLPETVLELRSNAISTCDNLARVHFPSTLKFIGDSAFYNAYKSSILELPEGLEHIGAYAFYFAGIKGFLTLPEGLKATPHK